MLFVCSRSTVDEKVIEIRKELENQLSTDMESAINGCLVDICTLMENVHRADGQCQIKEDTAI